MTWSITFSNQASKKAKKLPRNKARHTSKLIRKAAAHRPVRRKSIPWREVARKNIKKYTETGLALRGARLRAEMTQKELADAIGAQPHHISEMEHGKRSIGKEIAHRLAKILNMSYRMFL